MSLSNTSGLVRFFPLMFVWAAAAVSGAFLELPFLTPAHTHSHIVRVQPQASFRLFFFVVFCFFLYIGDFLLMCMIQLYIYMTLAARSRLIKSVFLREVAWGDYYSITYFMIYGRLALGVRVGSCCRPSSIQPANSDEIICLLYTCNSHSH